MLSGVMESAGISVHRAVRSARGEYTVLFYTVLVVVPVLCSSVLWRAELMITPQCSLHSLISSSSIERRLVAGETNHPYTSPGADGMDPSPIHSYEVARTLQHTARQTSLSPQPNVLF